MLTAQHLYVLEDNYDGTYETHFEFVLREVDDIRMKQDSADNGAVSVASLLITGILGALVGFILIGGNFLVFPSGSVYNKCYSVHEWFLREMAILGIRGRQRVYGGLHTAVPPKERSIDHDIDRKRDDRAA